MMLSWVKARGSSIKAQSWSLSTPWRTLVWSLCHIHTSNECNEKHVQSKYIKPQINQPLHFAPSPASSMCSDMAFSTSLFYHNTFISHKILSQSLELLAKEAPILAGKTVDKGFKLIPRYSNARILVEPGCPGFVLNSVDRNMSMSMAMESIWTKNSPLLLHESRQHAHSIHSINRRETDDLVRFDLVQYRDGSVLTLHIAHVLADAGRATRILERLSAIYESLRINIPYHPCPVQYDTWYSKHCQKSKMPTMDAVLQLGPLDLLSIPGALNYHTNTKFAPMYLHIPETLVENMIQQAKGQVVLSKLDVVQAVNIALIRTVRMMPSSHQKAVINVDLSRILSSTDTLGNSSDFLEIPLENTNDPDVQALILTIASKIRHRIQQLKSNAHENIQTILERQSVMSMAPKHLVLAAFMVHGMREKLASCSAVASFSFEKVLYTDTIQHLYIRMMSYKQKPHKIPLLLLLQVTFNATSPGFHHISSTPTFDWWSIIQQCPHKGGYISQISVPESHIEAMHSNRMTAYFKTCDIAFL